ncbi:MAG: inositol monophosphatase family protein [Polyangiales bacterium]
MSAATRPALLDDVAALMREVAAAHILPRFRALAAGDVVEKAPGELVTVADREAEHHLTARLAQLVPGVRVVGEEAVAADPSRLAGLGEGSVFLVDPLDGTANFVAGTACFAVMVALLHEGETAAAWLLDPVTNVLARAERGAGAFLERERLTPDAHSPGVPMLRGAVLSKYMPPSLRTQVEARAPRLGEVLPGLHCAGAEYPALASGRQDFAVFYRTLPWDHAPGALLVSEAGGVAARYDGTPYRPAEDVRGLLVARNELVWGQVRDALLSAPA